MRPETSPFVVSISQWKNVKMVILKKKQKYNEC